MSTQQPARFRGIAFRVLLVIAVAVAPAGAIEWTTLDGPARGFPALRDQAGKTIADGDFTQWVEKGLLHVRTIYSGHTRRIEENAVFRQRPELAQETWSLSESHNGKLFRQFAVNFRSRTATAKKVEEGELKEWAEDGLDLQMGRSFGGFGFTMAARALRSRLMRGEHVELQTVGFTPKPQAVAVDVSYAGVERMPMSGRTIQGERFTVHPKLPIIAKLFVDVPDAHIWLTTPGPATFLRWEGPLAEPDDPITRVDLLPGSPSGAATPVGTSGRRD